MSTLSWSHRYYDSSYLMKMTFLQHVNIVSGVANKFGQGLGDRQYLHVISGRQAG